MYGWIDPDNKFHECNVLGHAKLLSKIPKGLVLEERIQAEIEEVRAECQRMEDEQGSTHAEWHCLDIIEGDYLHNLYEAAYDAKFIRVGQLGSELHFEARREVYKDKYQVCKELADEYNKRPVFVPREGR